MINPQSEVALLLQPNWVGKLWCGTLMAVAHLNDDEGENERNGESPHKRS